MKRHYYLSNDLADLDRIEKEQEAQHLAGLLWANKILKKYQPQHFHNV